MVTLKADDRVLEFIYDKCQDGLYQYFHRDADDAYMASYIQENSDFVFYHSIRKVAVNRYVLNVARIENFGNFPDDCEFERGLIGMQLGVFLPVINIFLTGEFSDEKLERMYKERNAK